MRLTTATTQITVRTRIPGRFGSRSKLREVRRAGQYPIVTPIGVMFCIDV